jgi:hypothetical protein
LHIDLDEGITIREISGPKVNGQSVIRAKRLEKKEKGE